MRQKTNNKKNMLINYLNTGNSSASTVPKVSLYNLILHNPFHCSNIVSHI